MKEKIRILVVDDHKHARAAIREILFGYEELQLVAEARNGQEAIELAELYNPDVILMDINMPDMNGLDATQLIKKKHPEIKIVIITISDDFTHLFEALKRGAQGYLLKNIQPSSWRDYIVSIVEEEAPMPKELALKILEEMNQPKRKKNKENPLSQREKQVLELVSEGCSNRDIAQALLISEYTVKNHLKNIMHKLHLENRVQLTKYAYEQGWINNS